MLDSQRQTEEAATALSDCMEPSAGETNLCRAYTIMKRCYRHASARAPNPSKKQLGEGQGGFPDPLSERGTTHPLITPGNTHGPGLSEL